MAKPKTYRVAATAKMQAAAESRAARPASRSASPLTMDPKPGASVARAFWRFSLRLYRHPGVAGACLRLQDRHDLDVNMLLLCCFAARRGYGELSGMQVSAAVEILSAWNAAAILPLRAARRALKGAWPTPLEAAANQLRPRAARLELAAERAAQFALGHWLATQPPADRHGSGPGLAARALATYAGSAMSPLDRQARRDLDRLSKAALAD